MNKLFKYFLVSAGLALMGLQACSLEETAICPEEPEPGQETPIRFTTKAPVTRTTFDGNKWVTGDSIGIYMLYHSSASIASNLNANRKYTTLGNADGTQGHPDDLQAANSLQLKYQGLTDLRFIAYYPYRPSITNFTIPIDVAKQDNPAAIDLLYTNDNVAYNENHSGPIPLTFEHVLAKLVVNVEYEKSSDVNIHGMETILSPAPLTATFDLDGTLSAPLTTGFLELFGNGDSSKIAKPGNTDTVFQAIIIPHTINAAARPALQFKTQRRLYNWPLPANEPVAFQPGKVYTYNILLRGETVVGFTGEITPWDTITNPLQSGTQANSGDSYNRIVPGDKDTLAVRYIRAGQFQMGTNNPALTAAGKWLPTTVRSVEFLHSFHITETEITNAQFCKFLNDPANGVLDGSGNPATVTSGGTYNVSALTGITGATSVALYKTSTVPASSGVNYTITWDAAASKWKPMAGRDSFPIAGVTWYGALAYAKWAGGNLPTEAQWEYAARGGVAANIDFIDGTPTGTNMANYALAGPSNTPPQKVGQKLANGYGLYDVFGNVREWCLDRLGDGSANESYIDAPPNFDPLVTGGTYGALRGFGAANATSDMFIGNRYASAFETFNATIGFRVAFNFN